MTKRRPGFGLQTKHLILLTLNAAVWGITTLMWTGTIRLSAVSRLELDVTATPSRVRISIDGVPHEGGSYVDTPTTLRFLPGKHRILFQRAGYHGNSSSIVATPGEMPESIHTVLEAASTMMQEVIIDSPTPEELPNLYITIDGGLEAGPLPLVAKDLTPGTHILEIRSGILTKSSMRCQFEIPSTVSQEAMKISIERQGKRLRITGCKRIKS